MKAAFDGGQMSIFEYLEKPFKITKPIRLIELFAGIGSQAMALRDIGANFEHWRVVEFDKYAIASYNAIHGTNYPTLDITQITGKDLNIVDTESFTYLLTLFLVPTYRWRELWAVWKKGAGRGRLFYGKSKDFWKKPRTYHKFF